MKKMLENIKTNKLRATLIGVSAFLFGFISVSIFNNIGDTYALTMVQGGNCPNGYTLRLWVQQSEYFCAREMKDGTKCRNNEMQGCLGGGNSTGCVQYCYINPTEHCYKFTSSRSLEYKWGLHGASVNNSSVFYMSQYKDETSCLDMNKKCYFEASTGQYYWALPEEAAEKSWTYNHFTKKECLANNDKCYVCNGNSYVYGNFYEDTECKPHNENIDAAYCAVKNLFTEKPDLESQPNPPSADGTVESTSPDESNPEGTQYVVAKTLNYYAITYELNGGHFIDGSTSRTEYVTGDKKVGDMKTYPIKKGYAFVEWQLNGKAFDFSKVIDEMNLIDENEDTKDVIEITLKAEFAKHNNDNLYCEDENAELDYRTRKCYTVLKEDTSKNIYTHTTYLYKYVAGSKNARFCYAYNDLSTGDKTPGGVYFRNETTVSYEASGKNNNTSGVYANYKGNDYWISKETCRIGSPCYITTQANDYPANDCEITYSSIIYNEVDALVKEESSVPSDGNDEGNQNDGIDEGNEDNSNEGQGGDTSDDGGKPSDDKTDEELKENEKTGDALIIIAWLVGLSALGYTAYYFIRRNREN